MRSAPFEKSNSRHFSDVEPRLATSIFTRRSLDLLLLCQPLAECGQTFMRAGNHLHADNLADLRRRSSAGVGRGLHAGDVTAQEYGHITAADLFPAGESHVRRFERRVCRLEGRAQTLGFDHPDCLLCHKFWKWFWG